MSDMRVGLAHPGEPRMRDPRLGELVIEPGDAAKARVALMPKRVTPIVPRHTIAGRALVAVIAIMTFLASLTAGAVVLVRSAASDWQSAVAREVTVQIRPMPGRETDAAVAQAVKVVRGFPGVSEARAYTAAESASLLEPWLGLGLVLDDLPVPRVVVVRLAADGAADLDRLRKGLAEAVPGATLDDHRAWIGRMRAMSRAVVAGGAAVLALVVAATMLSVAFATRGAMAVNRPIVEVLHLVGAKHAFIAGQFQRHFLALGLKGGLIGGAAAALVFVLVGLVGGFGRGTAGGDQLASLFGSFRIGIEGYAAVLVQIVLIAAVTALASRRTVNRTLASVE